MIRLVYQIQEVEFMKDLQSVFKKCFKMCEMTLGNEFELAHSILRVEENRW